MKGMAGPCVLAALVLVGSAVPGAARTEIQQCAAARTKLAAKYHSCRAKADAKATRKMTVPDYASCAAKFAAKWDKARAKYGLDCIAEIGAAAMGDLIALQRDTVASIIAGTASLPGCGSEWIDLPGEQCDGAALGGATCASLGFHGGDLACAACAFDTSGCTDPGLPATGATVSYQEADDGAYQTGMPLHYIDNGDGTITDPTTKLMWEKKIKFDMVPDPANPHDADNRYPFGGVCLNGTAECGTDADCGATGPCDTSRPHAGLPDAPTIFDWVAGLNAAHFAGYDDWRIPNIKELQSLQNFGSYMPAVSEAFLAPGCGTDCADLADPACSCTATTSGVDFYWSSTTTVRIAGSAWVIEYLDGLTGASFKYAPLRVRAVRSAD